MTLPLPDENDAALCAEYDAAREREGRVMAILRALGPRAEVVRAFVALADAVLYGPAALPARERELVAVATSEANGAAYSAEVHRELLEHAGRAIGGPRDAALVEFARTVTLRPGEAADAADALRAHFSDAEVHDALAVVALLNYANRCVLATGVTVADDLS
jgi:uncharacterized peroxidase-related enzyme